METTKELERLKSLIREKNRELMKIIDAKSIIQNELESLKRLYYKLDRQLAEVDGRLKVLERKEFKESKPKPFNSLFGILSEEEKARFIEEMGITNN